MRSGRKIHFSPIDGSLTESVVGGSKGWRVLINTLIS